MAARASSSSAQEAEMGGLWAPVRLGCGVLVIVWYTWNVLVLRVASLVQRELSEKVHWFDSPFVVPAISCSCGGETPPSVEGFVCHLFSSPLLEHSEAWTPFRRGRVDYYKIEEGKIFVLFYDPVEVLAIAVFLKALHFKKWEWLMYVWLERCHLCCLPSLLTDHSCVVSQLPHLEMGAVMDLTSGIVRS